MSLNGIARVLGVNVKTVVRYFKENAELSRKANKKRIGKDLVTAYMQFDQMETFEHTKRKPVGIQVSIRWKTGEIITAKVGYIPIRALTVSQKYTQKWNRQARNSTHLLRMLETSRKALNKKGCLISCDQERKQNKAIQELYKDSYITLQQTEKHKNKKIDRVFRRMRQDISRLGRRTLSTTKDIKQLQNHLDLYTDYNNMKRVA